MNVPNLSNITYEVPFVPKDLPKSWTSCIFPNGINDEYWLHKSGLVVIASESTMKDGTKWIHISCSRRDRLPSWADIYGAKRTFIGDDTEAVQVLPKHTDLVDLANCYHLWSEIV